MKTNMLCGLTVLLAGSLLAADSTIKDDLTSAAKKLADKANYSWKTTVVVPEGARFRPGPTEGKTEKDGYTHVKMTFGENTTQIIKKGEKAAVTNPEGGWQALSELDTTQGPGRFMGRMIQNFKAPAAQAVELLEAVKELKKDGDAFSGEMTEEGAKAQMRFGRGGGGGGPTINNAKGSVKFWVKDGVVSKYGSKVTGKMTVNDNEMDMDRTTTVEIKDIGTTKVEVPADAKPKLN
jgi:hypothetical protein